MLGAELLAADHSGSESSSAAVRRKRSGPSQPTQPRMTHGSGSPGWIRVPLPSQELAVRVHRRDEEGGLPLPPHTPHPQTSPCQESWVPGELGATLCSTHPAAGALDLGSSWASFPLGQAMQEPLPHPSPKHPTQ